MKNNYGLVIDKTPDPEAFVLGGLASLPKVVLQLTGQWDVFLPQREAQNAFFETWNCTGYSTNAIFETILNRLSDPSGDKSDRYLAVKAGTRPPGNDPKKVAQTARDHGLIKEASLPYSNLANVTEYFSFKGGNEADCDREGETFLEKYDVGYEYVFQNEHSKDERIKRMKEALQYSPLGVSVSAWHMEFGVYVDKGLPNNHWTMVYGWNEKGWLVFDSYDGYNKILSFDHNIEVCIRYMLTKSTRQAQISIVSRIIQALMSLIGLYTKPVVNVPVEPPQPQPKPVNPLPDPPKYDWDTPILARHSVRVIGDENFLSKVEKDVVCAVIQAESGFDPKAVNNNVNGTHDYGICQINDYWWIGPGKAFTSKEEVLNDPEKSVRFMIRQFKAGKITLWNAFKNGSYRKFL